MGKDGPPDRQTDMMKQISVNFEWDIAGVYTAIQK